MCRDKERGADALARLQAGVPEARTELAIPDLASLASVRLFAQKELAEQRRIRILISNAGCHGTAETS
ncbi:NAD(P)-dependent dehydrogenase (short-subunit alcohol dehydrogenase family) [Paraburkholderia youngii]